MAQKNLTKLPDFKENSKFKLPDRYLFLAQWQTEDVEGTDVKKVR